MKKTITLIFLISLNLTQNLTKFQSSEFVSEIKPIKESKKDDFGYPAKIFKKANKLLKEAKKYPTSVSFYGYQTEDPLIMDSPSSKILIIKIEGFFKNFVGIEFFLSGFPVNGIVEIEEVRVLRSLRLLKWIYRIREIEKDFEIYYPDFDKDLKEII